MSATVRLSVPSRKYATLAAPRRLARAMDIKGRGGQAGGLFGLSDAREQAETAGAARYCRRQSCGSMVVEEIARVLDQFCISSVRVTRVDVF